MGVSRHWLNQIDKLLKHPVVRELVARYAEENPEATGNVFELVMHAFIAPLYREAKQDGWSEKDSWEAFEMFLRTAATGRVRLSPAEYELLVQVLSGKRKPVRRRRNKSAALRESAIADYLELLEADRWPPEAAVAKAQEVYGVTSRQTVYTAKRKRKEDMALFEPQPEPQGRDMTAEARRNRIELQEREAARWRRPKHPRRSRPKTSHRALSPSSSSV
jgi:hypothetical protein